MLKAVRALTPLQGAVLRVMAMQGEDDAPYTAKSLEAYAEQLAKLDPRSGVRIEIPNVQSALEALRAKSLAWRAAHGEYALEEQSLAVLMKIRGLLGRAPTGHAAEAFIHCAATPAHPSEIHRWTSCCSRETG
jgi:hypothetical protein